MFIEYSGIKKQGTSCLPRVGKSYPVRLKTCTFLTWGSDFPGISVANVRLNKKAADTTLPSFARCLESLSNLRILHILDVHHQLTTPIKKAFEGHTFPQIRTVILPVVAHNLLRCCPEVKEVTCTSGDCQLVLSTIAKSCKKVEIFNGRAERPNVESECIDMVLTRV